MQVKSQDRMQQAMTAQLLQHSWSAYKQGIAEVFSNPTEVPGMRKQSCSCVPAASLGTPHVTGCHSAEW